MGEALSRTTNLAAGVADVYSLNTSPDRGLSDADDVRPPIGSADLDADLDALFTKASRRGPACRVSEVFNIMPADTRAKVARLIDEPRPDGSYAPASEIAAVLTNHGWQVSNNSIQRHRRRRTKAGTGCSCE